MRSLILLSLVAVGACGSGSTGPRGPAIDVRVSDETGGPVDRTAIRVILSASRLEARTDKSGRAIIRLLEGGDYDVHVVPRAGYVAGIEPLTRNVSVEQTGTATVEFTVHRVGLPGEPMPIEW